MAMQQRQQETAAASTLEAEEETFGPLPINRLEVFDLIIFIYA